MTVVGRREPETGPALTQPAAPGPALGTNQVRNLDEVSVRLIEDDDVSANDEPNRFAIPDLAPGVVASDDRYLEWKFDGGHYRFNHRLALRRNAPVAD